MGILSRLRLAKNSDQLTDASAAFRDDLIAAEARLLELNGMRISAIEVGDEDALAGIRSELRIASDRIDDLKVAIEAADRKRDAAAAAERERVLEKQMLRASGIRDEMIATLKTAYPLVVGLFAAARSFAVLESELQHLNATASNAGRADLLAELPFAEWREKVLDVIKAQSLVGSRAAIDREIQRASAEVERLKTSLRAHRASSARRANDDGASDAAHDENLRQDVARDRQLSAELAAAENTLHVTQSFEPQVSSNLAAGAIQIMPLPFGPELKVPGFGAALDGDVPHWLEIVFPELKAERLKIEKAA